MLNKFVGINLLVWCGEEINQEYGIILADDWLDMYSALNITLPLQPHGMVPSIVKCFHFPCSINLGCQSAAGENVNQEHDIISEDD